MSFRNLTGVSSNATLRRFTTAQLTAMVAAYGPTGTVQANAIAPGSLVWDTTATKLKVFDGTAFLTVTAA